VRPTFLMTWKVTVVNPVTGTDPYGDQEETSTEEVDTLCHASPAGGMEDTVEARTTTADWSVYLPPDAPVTAASRLVLDGGPTLEVVAPPGPYRNPRTRKVEYLAVSARVVV